MECVEGAAGGAGGGWTQRRVACCTGEEEEAPSQGSHGAVHRDSMIDDGGKLQEAINQYLHFHPLFQDGYSRAHLSCPVSF